MTKSNDYTKEEGHKKLSFRTLCQSLYLTCAFYFENDLISYASTCAFGFLFSFVPVVMMILVITIRILGANADSIMALISSNKGMNTFFETINTIIKTNPTISENFTVQKASESIKAISSITNFEVIIAIAIILMARRFFSSIMVSLSKVFRQEIKARPVIQQFLSLGGEALLVIVVCVLLFAITTFKTVIKLPFLESLAQSHPSILSNMSQAISIFPYVLLFFGITVCYRIGSRTRPRIEIAAFAACGTTLTFFAFQKLLHLFINVNKYNFIYGALSGIIVLLMEVFFFFLIFLFFAQLLFVYQFFDTLILSQLYILPARDDISLAASLKRMLFIRPDALLKKEINVKTYKKGEYLYKQGENGGPAFYLDRGSVAVTRQNRINYVDKGGFFGEEACLLDQIRHENAYALTDIRVVVIPQEKFFALLERNPLVSRKALSKISRYFNRFHNI